MTVEIRLRNSDNEDVPVLILEGNAVTWPQLSRPDDAPTDDAYFPREAFADFLR